MVNSKHFYKQRSCPTTKSLASILTTNVSNREIELISDHLQKCDFCGAELQLLAAHSPFEENFGLPEMPRSLRQLAKLLLGGKPAKQNVLDQVFFENEAAQSVKVPLSL